MLMFPSFRKKRSKTIAHFRNILLLLHKNMTVKAKRKNFEDMQKQGDLTTAVVDTDDMLEKYRTKHPYEEFVDMIDQENVIVSKARKEWQVVRADSMPTCIAAATSIWLMS